MKKIFKLSAIAAACALLLGFNSCVEEQISTDQLDGPVAFAAMAPNPVVRGAELRIVGTNLQNVVEVRIPGADPITEIENVEREGKLSEIRVTVPLEGPQVGKVSIVDKNGNVATSKTDLTYTEGLVFEGFTAAEKVMPGDVITIRGEYVHNVQEVIFTSGKESVTVTGDAIFDKERHSAKVYVPAEATTGIIKIGDVNELVDQETIPNIFPSTEVLTVGEPTVNKAEAITVKAGESINITGEYLNMVKNVVFADDVVVKASDATLDEANQTLTIVVPAAAKDGDYKVVTYSEKEYVAGTLTAVVPAEMVVNKVDRYKAGHNITIVGKDIDLITSVTMGGVNANFWYQAAVTEEQIDTVFATIPFDAPDGEVVVAMANGSTFTAATLAFVNPTGTPSVEKIVAREVFEINGEDLELVTAVKVGGIDCKFNLDTLEVKDAVDADDEPIKIAVLDSTKIIVTTDPTIVSGAVTLEKANTWMGEIGNMEVTYNEPVSLELPASVALGKPMTVTGSNLFMIEAISVKGNKVTDFHTKTNTEMTFALPVTSPGVYKLDLKLIDGMELTWAIPFEVTAPYTETFIWEGSFNNAGWAGNQDLAWGGYDWSAVTPGTILRIYGTPNSDGWSCFSLRVGDGWGNLNGVPAQYDNPAEFTPVELTEEVLAHLISGQGLVLTGDNFTITGVSLVTFGETEKVIWEGNCAIDWSDNKVWVPASAFDGLEPGAKMCLYYTQKDQVWAQAQFNNGAWATINFNGEGGAVKFDGTLVPTEIHGWFSDGILERCDEVELTAEILENIRTNASVQDAGPVADEVYGLIIQGSDLTFTKITVM